jgi:Carboxypeptidase regulatory-like domain
MDFCRITASLLVICSVALGQTAVIGGRVSDESGAVVPSAVVTLHGSRNLSKTTVSDPEGNYAFHDLQSGDYTLTASAPRLVTLQPVPVTLTSRYGRVDLLLKVAAASEVLTVNDTTGPSVGTGANANASATRVTGADLQSLADDPGDLEADLQAIAGPATAPDGNEIFIDGFSGGQLPPKESIREVRVNANPFAPEFDKVGLGRIEIFTKPGADKYHGALNYNFGTDWWNTRNPYAMQKAPFLLNETQDNLSGPLGKRTSFTLDFALQSIENGSVINGIVLNPQTLVPTPFTNVFRSPQLETTIRPHLDYRLNDNNFLSFTYTFAHVNVDDAGIGGFDLTSRGYHLRNDFDTVQAIETSVLGSAVNETHFQFSRWGYATGADTPGASINVLGAFNGGGAPTPYNRDIQTASELHNITSITRGAHLFRFGMRLRLLTDDSYWMQGFNGAFTFTGGLAPELDSNNQPVLDPAGQAVMIQIPSIEEYRRTLLFQGMGYSPSQVRALGGGASQFNITGGDPQTNANRFDAAEFAGDEWRLRPDLSLSLGLRFESQSNISDHFDAAPRVGVAWAPGGVGTGTGKTVIRAGFGMFYTRFSLADYVTALRYNGIVQQQYVVTDPNFYPVLPPLPSLGTSSSLMSTQEIDAHLQSPRLMQSVVSVERQLRRETTLAVTYSNAHGTHLFRSEDINAPLPGTYSGAGTGVYPYPENGPIFLITSSGLYNQNQLNFNLNSRIGKASSLYLTYVLNKSMSDTDGINTFPGNPYNFAGEYGPAFNDIRHRILFGGAINTKWNVRLNPLVTFQTGAPFDITTGGDPYGTTLFNARPGIATDPSEPGLIQTSYGLLDPNPVPGETILGRNSGRGPFQIQTNLRVTKSWVFGGITPPGSGFEKRKYDLSLAFSARNLLNHNNPGPIIGNILSPLFGQANESAGGPSSEGISQTANNRRLEMQLRFAF